MTRPLRTVPTKILEDFLAGCERLPYKELSKGALLSYQTFCSAGVVAAHRLLPGTDKFDLVPSARSKVWNVLTEFLPHQGFQGDVVAECGFGKPGRPLLNLNDKFPGSNEARYYYMHRAVTDELYDRQQEAA